MLPAEQAASNRLLADLNLNRKHQKTKPIARCQKKKKSLVKDGEMAQETMPLVQL